MSSRPTASVAIVFLNAMPWLPYAVASVLDQSFADFELLLIDDGSTDGSLAFARSVEDPRVRCFSDGLTRRLHIRLNEAIARSTGEVFLRMDADDLMMPERLERQIPVVREGKAETVVGSPAVLIDTKWNVNGVMYAKGNRGSRWSHRHAFVHPTVAARRQWFVENKYSEDPIYFRSEDAELWLRTGFCSQFVNLETPALFYRQSGTNIRSYIASGMGLVAAAATLPGFRRSQRIAYSSTALAKIAVTCAFHSFGRMQWLEQRRGDALTPAEHAKAQARLQAIRQSTERRWGGSSRI